MPDQVWLPGETMTLTPPSLTGVSPEKIKDAKTNNQGLPPEIYLTSGSEQGTPIKATSSLRCKGQSNTKHKKLVKLKTMIDIKN